MGGLYSPLEKATIYGPFLLLLCTSDTHTQSSAQKMPCLAHGKQSFRSTDTGQHRGGPSAPR